MKHKAFAFVRPDGSFELDSKWDENAAEFHMQMDADLAEVDYEGYRVVQVEVEIPE